VMISRTRVPARALVMFRPRPCGSRTTQRQVATVCRP
jgi:hypothetical protein